MIGDLKIQFEPTVKPRTRPSGRISTAGNGRSGEPSGDGHGLALPDAQSVEDLTALLTSAGER
jgi:hypothetical protein